MTDLYVVSIDAVEDATFRGRVHNIPLWSECAGMEDEENPWEPEEAREEMATWADPAFMDEP